MSLIVTLHVFSGRPNPVWVLPDDGEVEFNERLGRIAGAARVSNVKPAGVTGGLGYRGFTIQDQSGSRSITIHAGVIDPGRQSMTLLTEDRELERWLLATGGAVIPEGARLHVERQLGTPVIQGPIIIQYPSLKCPICMAHDAPLILIWRSLSEEHLCTG